MFHVLVLILLAVGQVKADDCLYVDHSSHFGAVRDQGSVGWCYAYAGADLIGEHLQIIPPDMISAFDLATGYYATNAEAAEKNINKMDFSAFSAPERVRNSLKVALATVEKSNQETQSGKTLEARSGGYYAQAIGSYNLRGGYCLESQLPSQDLRYGNYTSGTPPSWMISKPSTSYTNSQDYIFRQIQSMKKEIHIDAQTQCPPSGSMGKYPGNLAEVSSQANDIAALEIGKLIEKRCLPRKPHGPIVSVTIDTRDDQAKSRGLDKIDSLLGSDDKGQSVGITYDSCKISAHSKSSNPNSSDCSHASVIVGRRMDQKTGICQYRVRNSWGSDCGLYDSKAISVCENGYYWIDKAQMKPLLQQVVWIE